jgi:hypothetical protein
MTRLTITEAYRLEQQELHRNPNYGVASLAFAPIVAEVMKQAGATSLCDYGAGKKNLQAALAKLGVVDYDYHPYDPAFPDYGPPRPADLVCCIDVLEHIEPDLIGNVIDELADITPRFGFFSIHTGAAQKFLSDGRNAHLIQKPSSWWLPRLCRRFEIMQLQTHQTMGRGIWVVVKPAVAEAQ